MAKKRTTAQNKTSALKATASALKAKAVLDAAKRLNDAVRAAWDEDGENALKIAWRELGRLIEVADVRGEEIPGWSGNQLNHADAINAVMDFIETYSTKAELES